jgi:hypothetical protein
MARFAYTEEIETEAYQRAYREGLEKGYLIGQIMAAEKCLKRPPTPREELRRYSTVLLMFTAGVLRRELFPEETGPLEVVTYPDLEEAE